MFETTDPARRMRRASVLAVLPVLALLSGCAEPLVRPEPPRFQSKSTHVADWQTMAQDSAQRFLLSVKGERPAVYVAPGPADMPFAAAYRNLLEQALLTRNFRVQEIATGAVVLRFGVQTFLYAPGDRKLPVEYATFWTTLGALGTQLRHVASEDTGAAIGAAAGPIIDVLAAMTDTTRAEVSVTTTVSDGRDLLYSDNRTIYVPPPALPLYWTHMPDVTPQLRAPDTVQTALRVSGR